MLYLNPGLLSLMSTFPSATQATDSTKARTAPYNCVSCNSTGLNKIAFSASVNTLYFAAWITMAATNIVDITLIEFLNGTTYLGGLSTFGSVFRIHNSASTVLASFDAGIADGVGMHIEVQVKFDPADGIFKVWKDGVLVIDFAGNTGSVNTINGVNIRGNQASAYFSDIIAQETRIGDQRVSILQANSFELCEWTETALPFGYAPINRSGGFTNNRTQFMRNNPILCNGTINYIDLYIYAQPYTIKFCLFRYNSGTSKWDAVQTTSAYTVSALGLQRITLSTPLNALTGDIWGWYATAGGLRGYTTPGIANDNAYLAGDYTAGTGLNLPTGDTWRPSIVAYLSPTNVNDMLLYLTQIVTNNPEVIGLSVFSTNIPDKLMLGNFNPDTSGVAIGSVKGVSVVGGGYYEGASACQKIAPLLRINGTEYQSADIPVSINANTWSAHAWETNPATGQPWTLTDLTGLIAGIKSRA
jgi:hypothetical protein